MISADARARWRPFLAATLLFAANRALRPGIPFLRHAILDESAHLATTTLALEILGNKSRPFVGAAMASSVLIDADHIPFWYLQADGRAARSRPQTHSLLAVAVAAGAAQVGSSSSRQLAAGVAFGLGAHLLRDITDGSGGAPLLWPLSRGAVRIPGRPQTPMVLAALGWLQLRRRHSSIGERPPVSRVYSLRRQDI